MRNIFLTTAALTLLPLVAMAQTATDTSTSTAGAVSEDVAGINQQFASSPAHTTVATVPEMGTQIVTPTATCTIPVTGQAVWLGMGVGGGTAYTVEYCKEAEQARIVYNMGDHASALMMMCSDAGFRKARALEGPIATCPPEYGPSGLTKAQTQQVDDQWIADNRAPAAPSGSERISYDWNRLYPG